MTDDTDLRYGGKSLMEIIHSKVEYIDISLRFLSLFFTMLVEQSSSTSIHRDLFIQCETKSIKRFRS